MKTQRGRTIVEEVGKLIFPELKDLSYTIENNRGMYEAGARNVCWSCNKSSAVIYGDIFLDRILSVKPKAIWSPTLLHPLRIIPGTELPRRSEFFVKMQPLTGLFSGYEWFKEDLLEEQCLKISFDDFELFFRRLYEHYQQFKPYREK